MKNERRPLAAVKMLKKGPTIDAFEAFFAMVESPAAVCDKTLTVQVANPAFNALCGVESAVGMRLPSLWGVSLEVPDEGEGVELEVECATGQNVTLGLSRRGTTVAVMAPPQAHSPTSVRMEQQLLDLARVVSSATSEEELIDLVAQGIRTLFPGRRFAVRTMTPQSGQLTSFYAEGKLKSHDSRYLYLTRSSVLKSGLEINDIPQDRVRWIDGELMPAFEDCVRALGVPLVASGQLFGTLTVEYPKELSADLVADDRLLTQLGNQVAVGVRNAKLLDEMTFVRKYLEELLEHANALILVVDRDRRVVVFNKALAQVTGYSREEVLGQEVTRFLPTSEHMRVLRVVASSLRGEQVSNFEMPVVSKTGQLVRIRFATSSLLTSGGDIEGVIAIGQDLTYRKELEGRVIQAEKLASLGRFAASVVHEINNPMTAVMTYADALLRRSLGRPDVDPSDVEKYRRMVDNCERVLRFTRDLASYSRPLDEQPESVNIQDVVRQALGFCEHVLKKHQIESQCVFTEVPEFPGVREKLEQVFVNLITNACHAMSEGGRVTLRTQVEENECVIQVQDTGTGIPKEMMPRLFEPFFTTKKEGRGTGLGLSIVANIVERHGGKVSVESEEGAGACFTVRLPLEP